MKILQTIEDPRSFRRAALVVVLIALLIRVGLLAAFWPAWEWHHGDVGDQWNELAINLVDHHTFGYLSDPENSSILRGPIFPFMEIPLYLVFGKNYAGWSLSLLLLDTLTCLLVLMTARRLWGNRAAILSGLFYALNLAVVFYTAKISQVTSVLPFVVLWLYLFDLWERRYKAAWLPWVLGVITGLMILNKTVYLPLPFLATGLLIWTKRRELKRATQMLPIAIYLFVSLAVVAPWTYRNYVVTNGSIVPVQSMFWELMMEDFLYYDMDATLGRDRADGASLQHYLAKQEEIVTAAGLPTTALPGRLAELEVQREKAFKLAAIATMKADPGKVVRVKLANLWHYWFRAENWRKTKMFIVLQAPLLLAALLGLMLLYRHQQVHLVKYGLLMLVMMWGEHCLVWGWGRLSLDLMPVLAVFFGLGFSSWGRARETVGGRMQSAFAGSDFAMAGIDSARKYSE